MTSGTETTVRVGLLGKIDAVPAGTVPTSGLLEDAGVTLPVSTSDDLDVLDGRGDI